jgi:phage I-like protein
MEKNFFYSALIQLSDSVKSTIQILKTGNFHHSKYGQFNVTPEVMDTMIANFPGPDRIPLDYNHGSLNPDPEKSKAAGWIDKIYKDGDRLMADVRFTERARGHVANGEFRYISPEFTFNRMNQESGKQQGPTLLAAALTNRPFLPSMAPVTLNDEGWIEDQLSEAEKAEIALNEKIEKKILVLGDESLSEKVMSVTRKFYTDNPDSEQASYVVADVRDDNIIVNRMRRTEGRKTFKIGFTESDNAIEFDAPEQWQAVRRTYEPVGQKALTDISNPSQNEEETPMDKELLKILGLSEDAEDAAIAEAVTALVDKAGKIDALETSVSEMEEKVAELITLSESEDTEDSDEEQVALTEENSELATKLTDVEEENVRLADQLKVLMDDKRGREAKDRVNSAVRDRKLLPAEVDGEDAPMRKLALNDPESFDAIIAAKPAYDKALLEINSADTQVVDLDSDANEAYWKLWDKLSSEHPELKSHEVRGLIDAEHSEVSKAAGL